MKKRKIIGLMIMPLLCMSTTSCSNENQIGILKYGSFDALNSAEKGFLDVLKENDIDEAHGYSFKLINANGDASGNSNGAKILMDSSILNLGIATPSALALKAAQKAKGKNTPILFTAVTDPKDAGLLNNPSSPEGNITGTSDMNPVADQFSLFKRIQPSLDKVGFLYCSNETNSVIQKNLAEAACLNEGIELIVRSFSEIANYSTTIDALLSIDGLDAIYVPTDNVVVSNFNILKRKCSDANVWINGAEAGVIKDGGLICKGISYESLGRQTGLMAVQLIKGEKTVKDIPVSSASELFTYINRTTMTQSGIVIPEDILENAVFYD